MDAAPLAHGARPVTFALIDGNSFYCSCERLFDRSLARRPVIVLSNNDGCTIARTAEAKAVGIKMGAPWFKIQELCARERVAVFSSNYELYGDISERMNTIYRDFAPAIEAYSIDETFLDLGGFGPGKTHAMAHELRARILHWVGMPTCVGLAPTKTLAKLANKIAKDTPSMGGVCDLQNEAVRAGVLEQFPAGSVWGIGRAQAARLATLGIKTAAHVRDMDTRTARKLMSVVGERLVLELRGQSCLELEALPPQRKGLCVTRCFGARVTSLDDMEQALATYAAMAGEKLRRHGLATSSLSAFMGTARHGSGTAYSASHHHDFAPATNDTRKLIAAARAVGRRIWRDGHAFYRAGVICSDLTSEKVISADLFDQPDTETDKKLMQALDRVNLRFGQGAAMIGTAATTSRWKQKSEHRSPRYTTRLAELPVC